MVNLWWFKYLHLHVQRPVDNGGPKEDLRSFKLIMEYIKALPVSYLVLLSRGGSLF